MKIRNSIRFAVVTAAAFAALDVSASTVEKSMRAGGFDVQYKVILPDGYDAAKAYPAVLVMGGGPQTMNTVDGTLERNFRAEAERRGYIVVAPAAPNGELFFEDGARIFPEFLNKVRQEYKIEGGKFHVAGPSNGGIAAMHVAAANPDHFLSVTAFPGYLWQPSEKKLAALSKMCVYLYVGENDEYRWHDEMQREVKFLQQRGTVAKYSEEKGQPHRIETLAGASASRLFDGFEAAKNGCTR
ncbi:MAG TPA: alpha/beta hydrolase-fold protein [Gammaproteobacteria bacterium]|nr:alpha/beta hydrolase-fold protein [Gammaproteobacteria bacterium]